MQETEADHQLIKSLVDWRGGVVSRVAREVGVAASTINRHYNGTATTRLGRDTIAKLRERYPDFPQWDTPGNRIVRSEVASFGDRPFDEKYGSGEQPAIPVLGAVIGMRSFDLEHNIELAEIDTSDVLDHVARPASLARDREAYALTVLGDSMWPRFRPGRRVIVSPRAPVAIGDDVIVQIADDKVQTAQTTANRVTTVLIKELVRRTATHIELRQFNPDTTFKVPLDQVAAVHKVVGEVF